MKYKTIHFPLLKKLFNKIKLMITRPFIRNVFVVASGTILMQIITILFSPIYTRLFSPEAIGIFDVFSSTAFMIVPIGALTFPLSIILPKEDSEAKDLVILSLGISSVIFVLLLGVFYFFDNFIVNTLQINSLQPYLLLIPFMVFFSTNMETIKQWLIRKNMFYLTSKVGVIKSLFVNISKVLLGLIVPTAGVLIVITVAGQGIYVFLLLFGSGILSLFLKNRKKVKPNKNIIKLARKYKEFPMYRAPQSLINSISSNLPILMLTAFYGSAASGFYAMGNRILRIPSVLIGKAIGEVFYPRFSRANNNDESLLKILLKATLILMGIGLIPFSLIMMFGPLLFGFVFGENWILAGVYARWIGIWAYTSFVNIPSVMSLPVLGAQRYHLIHTVLTIICKVGALSIGQIFFNNDIISIAFYAITAAFFDILLILVALYKSYIRGNKKET